MGNQMGHSIIGNLRFEFVDRNYSQHVRLVSITRTFAAESDKSKYEWLSSHRYFNVKYKALKLCCFLCCISTVGWMNNLCIQYAQTVTTRMASDGKSETFRKVTAARISSFLCSHDGLQKLHRLASAMWFTASEEHYRPMYGKYFRCVAFCVVIDVSRYFPTLTANQNVIVFTDRKIQNHQSLHSRYVFEYRSCV